ncbi:hypothetical protein IEQ34_022050 [Dendrobium chrysotoxum]|uniref:Myb/SANT-like DNA-binding domain-containing protein n=1 Tax=Dendrobium chrysotoxum TaxID=161865 RepID=A0AAV7FY06_DENCH|nr:hypothetical protein IEQ34_022050 [Dendrobium chrysotoxum]
MERKNTASARPPNPAMPYREDCWSEGETSMLVDAWGDRYLELNRGNIRQKQWQEVADAVNARPSGGRRPPRTDVQCKNRIDTLKKKYKIEKAKISDGAIASQWPFYSRLDMLVGSSVPPIKPTPSPSPPLALPLPTFIRRSYSAAAAAVADGDSGSLSKSSRSSMERRMSRERKRKREIGEGDGMRELARGIGRLAEIYENLEGEKHRQMIELEKQRMEFIKGLEFQRMQMFVDTQVQLEKIKRTRRSDAGEMGLSIAFPSLLQLLVLSMS